MEESLDWSKLTEEEKLKAVRELIKEIEQQKREQIKDLGTVKS